MAVEAAWMRGVGSSDRGCGSCCTACSFSILVAGHPSGSSWRELALSAASMGTRRDGARAVLVGLLVSASRQTHALHERENGAAWGRPSRGEVDRGASRFDSALRLNVHAHTIALDGVYLREEGGALGFRALPPPTITDVSHGALRARRSAASPGHVVEAAQREVSWGHGPAP
jgi:hypothetical protein